MAVRAWARTVIAAICMGALVTPGYSRAEGEWAGGLTDPRVVEFRVESGVLGESRPVRVYLPPGYAGSDERYFTVYVLDGEQSFYSTAGVADALYQSGYPKLLVVSIPNVARSRDLTPSAWQDAHDGGGADNFLRFLRDELRAEIGGRFRVSGYRVLVGHSFGGLFATHVITTDPGAFDAYVSISPSVFYDGYKPLDDLVRSFGRDPGQRLGLYVAMGAEPGVEGDGIHRLYSALAQGAPPWLDWRFERFPRETHSSAPIVATLDGLRWVFRDCVMSEQQLAGGLGAVREHYVAISGRFGKRMRPPQRVLANLGFAQIETGELDEAERTFVYFVEVYPGMILGYDALAEVHIRRGETEEAIAMLERVLELEPGYGDAAARLRELRGE